MRKILAFFALACLTPALAADDDWVARLNAWADEFQIPADILPRERDALLKLDALHLFQNDWSNRPKITYLPPEIGELRQLERLQLQNNSLAELPAEITNLRQLYFIGLDGNRFTDFPTVLFQLPQLSTVSLMDNPLTRLPPEIGEFQQLRSLNVSGCGLTCRPDCLSCANWQIWISASTSLTTCRRKSATCRSCLSSGCTPTRLPRCLPKSPG